MLGTFGELYIIQALGFWIQLNSVRVKVHRNSDCRLESHNQNSHMYSCFLNLDTNLFGSSFPL